MEQIDELFGQFIREQEILGRAETTIRGYKHSFNYFRKLMPDFSADNINDEKILEFLDILRATVYWKQDINDFSTIKPFTVLNAIMTLWCFFIWLKKKGNYNIDISDNLIPVPKKTFTKSEFFSIYCQKRSQLFKDINEKICSISQINVKKNELVIIQLSRRFNCFFNNNDVIFFNGIADYVRCIVTHGLLFDLVNSLFDAEVNELLNDDYSEIIRNNSDLESWFNLELVYILFYKIRELKNVFSDENDIVDYINQLCCELNQILKDSLHNEPNYFRRNDYDVDISLIHHCLIEYLENERSKECPDVKTEERIFYKFNEIGIPSGELCIKGFEPIEFTKKPALVLQFYYLNRCNNDYYSYHDFNEYLSEAKKHVVSNDFRLLIDSINQRVKSKTAGVIKKIIVKQSFDRQIKKTNYYRFIKT